MVRQFIIPAIAALAALGAASTFSSSALADEVSAENLGSELRTETAVTPESGMLPEEELTDGAISIDQVYYPYMCSSTDSAGQHWWGGSDKSNSKAKRSALAKCRRGSSNPSSCRIESCD